MALNILQRKLLSEYNIKLKFYSDVIHVAKKYELISDEKIFFGMLDFVSKCNFNKENILKHSNIPNENFKYTYNQNEFLSPKAIEAKLDSLNTAQEKLEFVYDAIYMNKNKNRFAKIRK